MRNIFFFTIASAVLCSGCTKAVRPDDLPELYPVTIELTQDEKPLEGAVVSLIPLDHSSKWDGGAVTDSRGIAHIVTHGKYSGLARGKYKISVFKKETDPPPEGVDPTLTPVGTNSYYLVDQKYLHAENSPLDLDVQGKIATKFDLGPPVRIKASKIE